MDNSIIYKKNSNISENYFTISDSKKKVHINDLPYEILKIIFKDLKNNYQAYKFIFSMSSMERNIT